MNACISTRCVNVVLLATIVLYSSQSAFGQTGRRGRSKSNSLNNAAKFAGTANITKGANTLATQGFQSNARPAQVQNAWQAGFSKPKLLHRTLAVKNQLPIQIKQNLVANPRTAVAGLTLPQQGVAKARPLGNAIGPTQGLVRLQHLRQPANRHLCWSWQKWCGYYPSRCHWWYGYCGPSYYFDPTCTLTYDWYDYYRYPLTFQSTVAVGDVRWALGLKCVFIPGKGMGIIAVNPGSPAGLAGLEPGMIILAANGMAMVDESSMAAAMDQSGGVLRLDVLGSASAAPTRRTVRLKRLSVATL